MAFLIALVAFLAVMLIVISVFMFLREREQESALSAKVMEFTGEADHEIAQENMTLPQEPVARQFALLIRYFGNRLKPKDKNELSLIQKRFQRAGLRSRHALVVFFGSKAVCAICLAVIFVAVILLFKIKMSFMMGIVLVVLLSLYGFYLPNLWLSYKTSRRQETIREGFPDALDLLAVCVEAGMGLDAAIKRVGDEMQLSNKVLSDEFRLLNLEMRAGKERKDAMKSMADRIDLEDVSSWVSLLIQTDKLGTSISQALRIQSDTLRTKRSQRLEEIAAKIPVKLLFPTIFFIFPALFVVILGPAAIRIIRIMAQH
ncbi:MAG: type II secretion system F family protein [Smithella sp.]|nr:type II secretion system F family protein [Smithella sp.]HQJ68835.1 type II secretion system F family protein [Anaerohalosphaeraceae bacterium]